MTEPALFERCRLVLDCPREGSPSALIYLAERVDEQGRPHILATSPVFRPDLDSAAQRQALANLEANLVLDGWERLRVPKGAIGIRYQRRR